MAHYQIGVDLKDDVDLFCARTGLEAGGAILVRPDGFIGWRSRSSHLDPAPILDDALNQVLCRDRATL
ncbi:MAG: hypothetical protein C3F11_15145 [Methylocystaceae bacterium]|nr:MAG: hypothetical protein C3F11_15145 [Methylocystaceae bacterium]